MPDSTSLSQKILGFFVKEAAPSTATGANPPAPAPTMGNPPPPLPGPTSPKPAASAAAATSPALDTKFAEHFAQVLAKNNPPGPDYFEFREALRGLSDLGLPEAQRYQAAWASFKAMGGPPDRAALLTTAQQYLNALRADRAAFQQSAASAATERVGALQAEQQRLRAENEALTRQLAELQARLTANSERLRTLDGETAAQAARLDERRSAYDTTYAHFTGQIEADIARIGQHLA
jgi:FtsZ-binding cell division protein ZapB